MARCFFRDFKNSIYQAQQDHDLFLQEAGLEMMKCFYLNDEQTGKEPDISPLYHHLDSLKLMPNTNIIVGEIDRLLTDAVAATYLIKHANVPVKLTVLEGQSHNHFSHRDLRDGVFVADIIVSIITGESYSTLKGEDGLGIIHTSYNTEPSSLTAPPKRS